MYVESDLVSRFGLLTRKIWNAEAYRGHVNPHEFIQEVSRVSKKMFSIGSQSDPIQFLSWLLNNFHLGLVGTKRKDSSVIHTTFLGELKVESQSNISIGTIDGESKYSETGYMNFT